MCVHTGGKQRSQIQGWRHLWFSTTTPWSHLQLLVRSLEPFMTQLSPEKRWENPPTVYAISNWKTPVWTPLVKSIQFKYLLAGNIEKEGGIKNPPFAKIAGPPICGRFVMMACHDEVWPDARTVLSSPCHKQHRTNGPNICTQILPPCT